MFKTGKKKQGATRNAHRTTPSAVSRLSGLQSWLLVILGVGIGLFIAFMLYLWKPWQPVQRAVSPQTSSQPADAQPKEPSGPRFDFYRLLPSQKIVPEQMPQETNPGKVTTTPAMAVVTPSPDTAVKPKAEEPVKAKASPKPDEKPKAKDAKGKDKAPAANDAKPKDKEKDDGQKYTLQAGSFKSQAEADRRRAKILMLGMSAHVQEVKVKEGQIWYRVIVGPVKGKSGAESAQSNLHVGGIDSLMVKQSESGAK